MATFYNQATLSYNGIVKASNITSGEIMSAVSVTKTPVSAEYSTGSSVTYIVNIVNSGSVCYENCTLTDDLGTYAYGVPKADIVPLTYEEDTAKVFVNGVLQTGVSVTALSPLTITGINIPAGGNASVVYSAAPNEYAPLGEGGEITNTAEVSGTGFTPVSASAAVSAENAAELDIVKSLSPAAVEENGQVTYTFEIRNTGTAPVTADDTAVFTDTFDPVLTSLTATYNGTPWTAGTNYTYDAATGVFTTADGQITVPAAAASQDTSSGIWSVTPGVSTLVITGNIS